MSSLEREGGSTRICHIFVSRVQAFRVTTMVAFLIDLPPNSTPSPPLDLSPQVLITGLKHKLSELLFSVLIAGYSLFWVLSLPHECVSHFYKNNQTQEIQGMLY